jgi:hypothetical protein
MDHLSEEMPGKGTHASASSGAYYNTLTSERFKAVSATVPLYRTFSVCGHGRWIIASTYVVRVICIMRLCFLMTLEISQVI